MADKTLPALRRLQKKQFTRATKEELIDAILAPDSNDTTVSARQDEKLDLVVKELAELKHMITTSENEPKLQIKELKETIIKQSEIIVQHQLFLEQLGRQKREINIVSTIPDGQNHLMVLPQMMIRYKKFGQRLTPTLLQLLSGLIGDWAEL